MKILYIHQYFTTPNEASGTRSYEFARHLVSRGHEVTILTAPSNYILGSKSRTRRLFSVKCIQGIRVVTIANPFSYTSSFISRVLGFICFMLFAVVAGIKVRNYDVVFATSTPLTVGIPGYILSSARQVPFVFEVRDLWPDSAVATGVLRNALLIKMSRWLEELFYRKAARIVTLTQGIYENLKQRGIPEKKLDFISHGADLQLFHPMHVNGFRKGLKLEDKFVCVYAGAHGLANGLEQVIEAARILKEHRDVLFILIGTGKEKPPLMEKANSYDLPNVLFLDPMPKVEVRHALAEADVGLMVLRNVPLFSTACPNKLFDYLASGKPVLVNFDGETRKLLEEHRAGIFVDPDYPQSMAEAVLKLKHNPELKKTMGLSARKLAEAKFDRTKLATKFETLLLEVVNN